MNHILAVPVLLALCTAPLLAQHPTPHFNPGEWEIDSVNIVMGGRAITSQTRLCAKEQMDFWKVAQAGLTCKPPKIHPVRGGIQVKIHCAYSKGSLHSEILSDAVEIISANRDSFTLTGTTTTDTVYQGVQPKRTSTTLQASARRLGECP